MKTFTEFKKHLQETKAKKEYKATDLDKQITQEIDAVKEAGDNEKLSELEAIRDEKDKEVKESRFKIYMDKKNEDDSSENDPDADSVQEEKEANDSNDPDVKKVKDCEQMTPRQKKIKMERLRDRK